MGDFIRKSAMAKLILIVIVIVIALASVYLFRFDRFGMAKISWIDCIQYNGERYVSQSYPPEVIDKSKIGSKIGIVTFNVARKVGNPSYKFRNGDATYLEVGTVLYAITEEPDMIAAYVDGSYLVYRKGM